MKKTKQRQGCMRGMEELFERMIMEYCIDNGKYDGKNDEDDSGDGNVTRNVHSVNT